MELKFNKISIHMMRNIENNSKNDKDFDYYQYIDKISKFIPYKNNISNANQNDETHSLSPTTNLSQTLFIINYLLMNHFKSYYDLINYHTVYNRIFNNMKEELNQGTDSFSSMLFKLIESYNNGNDSQTNYNNYAIYEQKVYKIKGIAQFETSKTNTFVSKLLPSTIKNLKYKNLEKDFIELSVTFYIYQLDLSKFHIFNYYTEMYALYSYMINRMKIINVEQLISFNITSDMKNECNEYCLSFIKNSEKLSKSYFNSSFFTSLNEIDYFNILQFLKNIFAILIHQTITIEFFISQRSISNANQIVNTKIGYQHKDYVDNETEKALQSSQIRKFYFNFKNTHHNGYNLSHFEKIINSNVGTRNNEHLTSEIDRIKNSTTLTLLKMIGDFIL
jgi:hypothetical protein